MIAQLWVSNHFVGADLRFLKRLGLGLAAWLTRRTDVVAEVLRLERRCQATYARCRAIEERLRRSELSLMLAAPAANVGSDEGGTSEPSEAPGGATSATPSADLHPEMPEVAFGTVQPGRHPKADLYRRAGLS